ncbi:MAG: recombinase family protein [Verrucomicrobia bacterium]|nr:recombinase family protein [Verrucomicrobiota bacterium]
MQNRRAQFQFRKRLRDRGALKRASCKRIFTDKVSGAKADRPGLRETLSHLRETDTLVVWKLNSLGRSVKGLVDLVNELQERHLHFKSLTDGIDTKTPAGRFFFHVMAGHAHFAFRSTGDVRSRNRFSHSPPGRLIAAPLPWLAESAIQHRPASFSDEQGLIPTELVCLTAPRPKFVLSRDFPRKREVTSRNTT